MLGRSTAEERKQRLATGRAEKAIRAIYEPGELAHDTNAGITIRFLAGAAPDLLERIVDQCSDGSDKSRAWKRLLDFEMFSPEAGGLKEENISEERIQFYLNRTRRSLAIIPLAQRLIERLEPSDNRYSVVAGMSRIERAVRAVLDDRQYSKEETAAVVILTVLRHMASGTSRVVGAHSYAQIEQDVLYVIANHNRVDEEMEVLFERNAYTADFIDSLISIETKPLMEGQL